MAATTTARAAADVGDPRHTTDVPDVDDGDGNVGDDGRGHEEEHIAAGGGGGGGDGGGGDGGEESWKDDDFLSLGGGDGGGDGGGGGDGDGDDADDGGEGGADDDDDDEGARQGRAFGLHHRGRGYAAGAGGSLLGAGSYSSSSSAGLPPWMDRPNDRIHRSDSSGRMIPPLVLLHNEIVDFADLMAPGVDEIREREDVVERIKVLVTETFGEDKCAVHTFGSQATGLSLPTSDIDLVVLLDEKDGDDDGGDKFDRERDDREMDEWDVTDASSSSSPLARLADALRRRWSDDLTYLEVVEKTRVPIVKFTLRHGAGYRRAGAGGGGGDDGDDPDGGIDVDICFDQTTGVESARLVRTFMEAMPPLRPLTFVLKYFTAARGINEPYTGGIGSFLLQMMIVSFLQHREREEFRAQRGGGTNLCLGALLLEFLELYGLDFNYVTTGISVRSDGFYFPKGSKERRMNFWSGPSRLVSLGLENPFEPESDVGRASYRMNMVQKSFEVAFRTLMSHVSDPPMPAVSILASILPPTQEMERRAAMRKVDRIERAPVNRGTAAGGGGGGVGGGGGGRGSNGSDMDVSSGEEVEERGRRQKRRRRR